MRYTSKIEINSHAVKKNIKYLQKRIGKNAKFTSVIKGNAYGHGIEKYLPLAEESGLRSFAVSDSHEAEQALNVKCDDSEIIIMYMIDNDELEWAIENDIAFYVFEFDRLDNAILAAKKLKKKCKIHVELETGMNRTGFLESEIHKIIEKIKENLDYISFEGLCTHFAGAESVANYLRIKNQISKFHKYKEIFKTLQLVPKNFHTACSAAVLTYPETIENMVRIGIAQYGYWPSAETRMYNLLTEDFKFSKDPLTRAIRWTTQIMSIKEVKAGEFVSYGTSYMAPRNEKIAVIPVGYSHGYSRSLSNLGHVLIRGRKAAIIGMVNMNMLLANVSSIPFVRKGDEVVLIGKQGHQLISVSSFADLANYVNYEMLTRLPADIPRFVI